MNNLKFFLLSALMLCIGLSVPAQNTAMVTVPDFAVMGKVADTTGVAEEFATVRIFAAGDTVKPVATLITGEQGEFLQPLKRPGSYSMTILSTGRQPIRLKFDVTEKAPVAKLGTLVIHPMGKMLKGITVDGVRPLISREIDRIAYDVANDPEASTTQLDEMLKRVPLVTVDPDGTIKIKGSSSFLIYKNGRRNNAFSNNAKEIFKSIPAAMIQKIEVITDPGAREDAEGVGMILNIVTKEQVSFKGVVGNVGLSYSSNSNLPNPSIWLMSQIDKVTFSVYGSVYSTSSRTGKQMHVTDRVFDDTGNRSHDTNVMKTSDVSENLGFELSYEIDTLNLITADFHAYLSRNKKRNNQTIQMFDPDNDLIYSYKNRSFFDPATLWHYLGGNFNYQRLTRKKGEKIIFSYQINGNGGRTKFKDEYYDDVNIPVPYDGIYSNSRASLLEHTFQIDWTRPLWKGHTLDLGGKYVYRDNHSMADRDYLNVGVDRSNFSHITQIGALFADYRIAIGRWGLRAGIRYEYSRLAAKFHLGDEKNFHSNLNDWVPNAAISYNINDKNSLRLSYSSSIQRPGINYLNPTVKTNPQSTSQGNPGLSSLRNQSMNLNYSLFSSKVSVDFNSSFGWSNNAIISVQTSKNDHLYYTYDNAGRDRYFSNYLYIMWSMTRKTRVMVNGGISYNYYKNPSQGIKFDGWTPSCYFRVQQTLPWKLALTGYVNYYGGSKSLYQIFEPVGSSKFNHGLGLQRSFLKENRLNVRLQISNPFGYRHSKYRSHVVNQPYQSYSRSEHWNNRTISISIAYRFGKLNAQVKKVRGISNNDVVGGNNR